MSLPAAFVRDAERLIPQDRRFTDALSTLAKWSSYCAWPVATRYR